ncbi:MAG: hypothetical protein QOE82_947 [Thermoanaerobaculia bacterium]|jgi:hypothetical protein|nr:hypothetical protein [Thermoanaerobaculia bacterium]
MAKTTDDDSFTSEQPFELITYGQGGSFTALDVDRTSSLIELGDLEIVAAQREELERRWIDFQQKPDDGESWSDVKNSLLDE